MVRRALPLAVLAALLMVFGGSALAGQKDRATRADKDSHTGTFVSAKAHEFTMKDKSGKEHTHTLAVNARVIDADGKECKITDLKEGQRIRVTTREGDKKVATRVEVLRKKKK
jgi:hypothetical protein